MLAAAAGDRFGLGLALTSASLLALEQGDTDRARALAVEVEALDRAMELGDVGQHGGPRGPGLRRSRRRTRLRRGTALRRGADDCGHRSAILRLTARAERQHRIDQTRVQLGQQTFDVAFAAGKQLSLEAARSLGRLWPRLVALSGSPSQPFWTTHAATSAREDMFSLLRMLLT